jgi:hypothetical protein
VTEAQWLACTDPMPMLEFLCGKASDRKLRLFACAVARELWDKLDNAESRRAIEAAEKFADGLVTANELKSAWNAACLVFSSVSGMEAAGAAANCAYIKAAEAATSTLKHAASWAGVRGTGVIVAIRDIIGNPFRPSSINAAWLAVNDAAVVMIAQAVYVELALDRMGILADALEDAGCTDPAILTHLRSPGPHVRGCWVLDLLTGRE